MRPMVERAPVPSAKLREPFPAPDHVPRPRVVDAVISGSPLPVVTTIAAAAGSGKTVLLGQVARTLRRRSLPTAWLSLDEDDNDPFLLWSGVMAALGTALRHDGADPFLDVTAPRGPAGNEFLAALSAAVERTRRPACLILDDAHELRPGPALDGLSRLMSLAPDGLSFMLGCRREPALPLARWAVEGRARRLRTADLAFDRAEARAMLEAHGQVLSDADVGRLQARTEGWAVGLRLAALALREAPDPGAGVAGFVGHHRPVADYLLEEVLAGLAPDVRQFLRATSIVAVLPTGLARELSGRSDAGAVLDRLTRDNALVSRLDGTPVSYRYHALLRDHLAAENTGQDTGKVRALHRVAATWFLSHGHPDDHLRHVVAAGDWAAASDMLERDGLRLVMTGHGPALSRVLAALPPPYRRRPTVALVAAHLALLDGDPARARRDIALAEGEQGPADDPRRRVLLASALLSEARLLGRCPEHATELAARSAEEVPGAPELELLATVTRAMSLVEERQFLTAETALARARDLAQRLGFHYLALQCMSYLTLSAAALHSYTEVRRRADRAIGFARVRGWSWSAALLPAYAMAAWSAWLVLDPAAVDRYLADASRVDALAEPQVLLALELLRAYADHERTPDAAALEAATRVAWRDVDEDAVSPVAAARLCLTDLRMALAGGRASWAEEVVGRAERFLTGRGDLAAIQAVRQVHLGRPEEARTTLRPMLASAGTTTAAALIAGWLTEARIAGARDEPERQHSALLAALDVAEPLTLLRPFVEAPGALDALRAARGRLGAREAFVDRLLTAAARRAVPPARAAPPGPADLTERELEILRALPYPSTIDAIAAGHQLSANTVKTHVRSVYRKLGVHGRRDAVARARQLRLL
jgi:LuxR family transcriptional regulator, maltose regulon positive regulatory protein